MIRSRLLASACLAVGLFNVEGVGAAEFPVPDDFVTVSGPASPRVAFALQRDAAGLGVVVEAAALAPDGGDVSVSVGLAAAQKVVLSPKEAKVERTGSRARFAFRVPAA